MLGVQRFKKSFSGILILGSSLLNYDEILDFAFLIVMLQSALLADHTIDFWFVNYKLNLLFIFVDHFLLLLVYFHFCTMVVLVLANCWDLPELWKTSNAHHIELYFFYYLIYKFIKHSFRVNGWWPCFQHNCTVGVLHVDIPTRFIHLCLNLVLKRNNL